MQQVIDFFENLFKAENWPPRWQCGQWTEFHGWLYILSNLAIWAAYFAIPLTLLYFIYKRKEDLPFVKIFWLFILFILACGTTHLIDAMLFYYPAYRLSGLILFITAVVSWTTIWGLIKIMPQAMNLKSPVQLEKIIQVRTFELEELSKDLTYQNEQLRSFTDITSHNLRAPASNMVSLMNLYDQENDPEKKEFYISKFKETSHKLINTLDDLYEVVKIKNENNLKKDNLSFEVILQGVISAISIQIEETQAIITHNFAQCPEIQYPKPYLESILLNLITNAIKYRSPDRKPEIHLQTLQKDDDIILTCQDNGIGLDMNKYGSKVFKLHKTFHKNPDARGLGLFIVKNQVEALDGNITMDSEVNKGTTFTIVFKN